MGHRGHIVVVEDDPSVKQAIGRLLDAAGFSARIFESAEELLAHEGPAADCLVLDANLPGISGFDLHRKLAKAGFRGPVVVISAHDDALHRRAAQEIGAAAYLIKPFSSVSLIEAVTCAIVPPEPR